MTSSPGWPNAWTPGRGFAGQRERANVNAAAVAMLELFDDILRQRQRQPAQDVLSPPPQPESTDGDADSAFGC
jgi:hypothetical protein